MSGSLHPSWDYSSMGIGEGVFWHPCLQIVVTRLYLFKKMKDQKSDLEDFQSINQFRRERSVLFLLIHKKKRSTLDSFRKQAYDASATDDRARIKKSLNVNQWSLQPLCCSQVGCFCGVTGNPLICKQPNWHHDEQKLQTQRNAHGKWS